MRLITSHMRGHPAQFCAFAIDSTTKARYLDLPNTAHTRALILSCRLPGLYAGITTLNLDTRGPFGTNHHPRNRSLVLGVISSGTVISLVRLLSSPNSIDLPKSTVSAVWLDRSNTHPASAGSGLYLVSITAPSQATSRHFLLPEP